MNRLILILISVTLLGFSTSDYNGFSKEIIELIKRDKYDSLSNYLQPIEQQRRILHWPDDNESTEMLKMLQDSLNLAVIQSAKNLKERFKKDGLDFNNATFLKCQRDYGRMAQFRIYIEIDEMTHSFTVPTIQTDKLYIALPIESKIPTMDLPVIEKPKPSDVVYSIRDGIKFRVFQASEKEVNIGKLILAKCLENSEISKYNAWCSEGLINESGEKLLSFILANEKDYSKLHYFLINMENETCEKEN